jgi:hypothetical protein
MSGRYLTLENLNEEVQVSALPEDEQVVVEEKIENARIEMVQDAADMQSEQAQVEEAGEISETLGGMIERAEATVTPEEVVPPKEGEEPTPPAEPQGMTEGQITEVRAAVEHFRTRLGVARPILLSHEAFVQKGQIEGTKQAIEEMKFLKAAIDKKLEASQEGLGARIANAFTRAFTSYMSVIKALPALINKVKDSDITDVTLNDEPWARIFASSGKNEVTLKDIEKIVSRFEKERDDIVDDLYKAARLVHDAAEAAQGSFLIAREKYVDKIEALKPEIDKIRDKIYAAWPEAYKGEVDVKIDAVKNAAKIGDLVIKAAGQGTRSKINNIDNWLWASNYNVFLEQNNRIIGAFAEDQRTFRRVAGELLYASRQAANTLMQREFLVAHGVMKLLKKLASKA